MAINRSFQYLDKQFDERLKTISSLRWLPWVGSKYCSSRHKLLIIGESCYDWKKGNSLTRLRCDSFARETIEFDDAINAGSKVKFYKNLERALYKMKAPSNNHSKDLWSSVCFHNLVQRHMESKQHRPTITDYNEGWSTFLDLSKILRPHYCIFAGTDSQKFRSLMHTVNSVGLTMKPLIKPVKIGRSKGRTFVIDVLADYSFTIAFIKHPSSFFNWEAWGDFLSTQIPAVSAMQC